MLCYHDYLFINNFFFLIFQQEIYFLKTFDIEIYTYIISQMLFTTTRNLIKNMQFKLSCVDMGNEYKILNDAFNLPYRTEAKTLT